VRRTALIALVVGAVVVPPSSAIETTLMPGVGIGKVKLGMTLVQVKKALGPPQRVNKRAQLAGRGYVEYGWDFSTLWVGFVNTKGVLHAVLVGTDLRSQGTFKGAGIGTVRETLRRKLPVVAAARGIGSSAPAATSGFPKTRGPSTTASSARRTGGSRPSTPTPILARIVNPSGPTSTARGA